MVFAFPPFHRFHSLRWHISDHTYTVYFYSVIAGSLDTHSLLQASNPVKSLDILHHCEDERADTPNLAAKTSIMILNLLKLKRKAPSEREHVSLVLSWEELKNALYHDGYPLSLISMVIDRGCTLEYALEASKLCTCLGIS